VDQVDDPVVHQDRVVAAQEQRVVDPVSQPVEVGLVEPGQVERRLAVHGRPRAGRGHGGGLMHRLEGAALGLTGQRLRPTPP
jgi:hypothetical protein